MTCFNNPKQPKIEIFQHCIYKTTPQEAILICLPLGIKQKEEPKSALQYTLYQNVLINKLVAVLQVKNHNAH